MQGLPEHGHDPVMVAEVLQGLDLVRPGPLVAMDCTAGRGGHLLRIAQAMAIADSTAPRVLIALDVDPENLKYTRHRFQEAAQHSAQAPALKNIELRTFHANFGEAPDVLEAAGIPGIDALLADFGVSTNQLLDAKHGLSFNTDLHLDMRLDPRIKQKASDLLSQWNEEQIATALQDYAQERFAWRIARKIVQTRATEPILTTGQLARLVRSVVPAKYGQIDPATRTFQALRMAVNSELESIQDLLAAVPDMMNDQAKAVFISFHSGEDRLVKQAARAWQDAGIAEPLTKKPQEPPEAEMHNNPRSRSAKLRAIRFLKKGPAATEGPSPQTAARRPH